MSDDEDDYYDEDDYFYIDDGPVAEADDLAEHVVHSPVWPDYDPSYDVAEEFSDWEYYSDDYYDQEDPRAKRNGPVVDGTVEAATTVKRKSTTQNHTRKKRRKVGSEEEIPEISLGGSLDAGVDLAHSTRPIVIWKTKNRLQTLPVVADGQGEKVALLKDWRERFKGLIKREDDNSAGAIQHRSPSRKGIASHPAGRHENNKVNGTKSRKRPPEPEEVGEVQEQRKQRTAKVEIPLEALTTTSRPKARSKKRKADQVSDTESAGKAQTLKAKDGSSAAEHSRGQPPVRRSKRAKPG